MITPDFHGLCAELVKLVEQCPVTTDTDWIVERNKLIVRFRQLLSAAPAEKAEGPTDAQILAAVRHLYHTQAAADMAAEDDIMTAHAVLARWGGAPQPVPADEREPDQDEANENGEVWVEDPGELYPDWEPHRWMLRPLTILDIKRGRRWLPANALPLPGVEGCDGRDPECVKQWPDCFDGGYDPRCCRFPKSCSCGPRHLPQPEVEG